MVYHSAKVYFDGSHYIAIPQKAQPTTTKGSGFTDIESDEKKKAFNIAYKNTKAKKRKEKLDEFMHVV